MTWNTHRRTDPTDSTRQQDVMSSKQNCSECNVPLEPIFKGDLRSAETWFWTECCICLEPVCLDCSYQMDAGHVCVTCRSMPNEILVKRLGK